MDKKKQKILGILKAIPYIYLNRDETKSENNEIMRDDLKIIVEGPDDGSIYDIKVVNKIGEVVEEIQSTLKNKDNQISNIRQIFSIRRENIIDNCKTEKEIELIQKKTKMGLIGKVISKKKDLLSMNPEINNDPNWEVVEFDKLYEKDLESLVKEYHKLKQIIDELLYINNTY